MSENLPAPVTVEQLYLAAILAELRAMRRKTARNGPPRPELADEEEIELREQRPKRR